MPVWFRHVQDRPQNLQHKWKGEVVKQQVLDWLLDGAWQRESPFDLCLMRVLV
jgi:hypothetical protein